jgi:hypothetical protein
MGASDTLWRRAVPLLWGEGWGPARSPPVLARGPARFRSNQLPAAKPSGTRSQADEAGPGAEAEGLTDARKSNLQICPPF